jgi:nitroreductase/dihydropteridine reductase
MAIIDKMKFRYTTKKYNSKKKIDKKIIEELKEILNLSPSSINSQPWLFTFVNEAETKAKLAQASLFNDSKVINCDTLVVFSRFNDLDFFEKTIQKELPEGAVNYYNQYIKPLPKEEIMAWYEKQVYLSIGVLLTACAQLGIDATPMEGIEANKYDKILEQTKFHAIVAVCIGYRAIEDQNQPAIKPKSRRDIEKVIKVI